MPGATSPFKPERLRSAAFPQPYLDRATVLVTSSPGSPTLDAATIPARHRPCRDFPILGDFARQPEAFLRGPRHDDGSHLIGSVPIDFASRPDAVLVGPSRLPLLAPLLLDDPGHVEGWPKRRLDPLRCQSARISPAPIASPRLAVSAQKHVPPSLTASARPNYPAPRPSAPVTPGPVGATYQRASRLIEPPPTRASRNDYGEPCLPGASRRDTPALTCPYQRDSPLDDELSQLHAASAQTDCPDRAPTAQAIAKAPRLT